VSHMRLGGTTGATSPAWLILHGTVDFSGNVSDLSANSAFNLAGTYALYDVQDCTSVTNIASITVIPRPGRVVAGSCFLSADGKYVCVTMT
jgi:hypothetical protein